MDLDLGCVASFAVLLDEGHYGRAAARLHLTSSALTKRIQRLELQVGTRLVHRGPTGALEFTPAGHRLGPEARALLAHAERVRSGAQDPGERVVRLGLPAGTHVHMATTGLYAVRHQFGRAHPDHRLAWVGVPFPQLTRALTEHRVDVLLTGPPLRDAAVECRPLQLVVERIGLVGDRHPLAGAGEADAAAFADLPVLHNPDVPAEWMAPFTLADVRGSATGRLVPADVTDAGALLAVLAGSDAVAVSLALVRPVPGLHTVRLLGAPPVRFHAAWRRGDHRSPVQDLVAVLRAALVPGPSADRTPPARVLLSRSGS